MRLIYWRCCLRIRSVRRVVRPTRRAMLAPRRRVDRVRRRVELPTRRTMLVERFRERRKKRETFMVLVGVGNLLEL